MADDHRAPNEQFLQIHEHRLVVLPLNPDDPGPPIVLMHGVMGSLRYWSCEHTGVFLDAGRCFAVTLPGHYPAAFPPGLGAADITSELLVDLLGAAISGLSGGEPALLVGYSTGGFAALALAACRPELARGVISISGFARGRWTGALGMLQWLARRGRIGRALFRLALGSNRLSPGTFLASWGSLAGDGRALHSSPRFRSCALSSYSDYTRLDPDAMLAYFRAMPGLDITRLLPAIRVPTLVLAGDRDPIVPPAQARLIAQRVPGAELVLVPGGGHVLFAERTEAYERALDAWLRRASAAGGG